MKGCKQALGALWQGQQMGGRALSPLDEKLKTSANQSPSSPSPASKVSGATALCPLSQAGPELPPSLPSGCQATEEHPAGTRGWHQGLHQAQHSHPAPPEGASCLGGREENGLHVLGNGSSGVTSKPFHYVFYALSLQGDFVVSMAPCPWG